MTCVGAQVLILTAQLDNVGKSLDKTLYKSCNILKRFLRFDEVLKFHNSLILSFSWDQ